MRKTVLGFVVGVGVGAATLGAVGALAQQSGPPGAWQVIPAPCGTKVAAWKINTMTGFLSYCADEGGSTGWRCSVVMAAP